MPAARRARYGLAYANGSRAAGIVPVAKHFPGLGHASADTDTGPATDPPLNQLETDDLDAGAISAAGYSQPAAAGTAAVSPPSVGPRWMDLGTRRWRSRWSAWPPPQMGSGYWLVAADGGIFTCGDAHFYGSST